MKYISTVTWRDNTDGHLYRMGEPFPHDGREISAQRLEELKSGRNRAGLRLIQACGAESEQGEGPEAEAPRGAKNGRETASAEKGTAKAETGTAEVKTEAPGTATAETEAESAVKAETPGTATAKAGTETAAEAPKRATRSRKK